MATSFVNYRGKGFWIKDSLIEFIQLCLINEIESSKIEEKEEWIKNYKLEISIQTIPVIIGGVSMRFDNFLLTESRVGVILRLVDNILFKIENENNYFTGRNMHRFRRRAMEILRDNGEIPTAEEEFVEYVNQSEWEKSNMEAFKELYIRYIFLLKGLLLGKLRTTASSPIYYWKMNLD